MTTFTPPAKYDRPAWGFWNELNETARCVEVMQREAHLDPCVFTDDEFVTALLECEPGHVLYGETVADRERSYTAGMARLQALQVSAMRRMLGGLGLATAEDARDEDE